jgi:hypothetical protein
LQAQKIGPPTNVAVQATAATATISWTPVATPGTTYRVLKSANAATMGTELGKPVSASSVVDAGVTPGTTYFYSVVAVYPNGLTSPSPTVSFTMPRAAVVGAAAQSAAAAMSGTRTPGLSPSTGGAVATAARPASPTRMTAQHGGFREVNLFWDLVPGVTQYRVFGPPPMPATGVLVTATLPGVTMYRATGMPTGTNTFTVTSEYPGATNAPGLASASILTLPFTSVGTTVNVELASNTVGFSFEFITAEPLTFKLFRDGGRGGPLTEVTTGILWNRSASTSPGMTRMSVRTYDVDNAPDRTYQYQVVVGIASGELLRSALLPVTIPQFIVRSTIPLSGDRVVIEWSPFGTAPYRVKKGVVTASTRPGVGGGLLMDYVRDASGNPMTFTATRFDDMTVQRGVTYTYMVCAPIAHGEACPGLEVRVPPAP